MQVKLMFAPGQSYIVTVADKLVLDVGAIEYKGDTYVYQPSTSFTSEPLFLKVDVLKLPDNKRAVVSREFIVGG